jgi:hypothetical protein
LTAAEHTAALQTHEARLHLLLHLLLLLLLLLHVLLHQPLSCCAQVPQQQAGRA